MQIKKNEDFYFPSSREICNIATKMENSCLSYCIYCSITPADNT